MSEVIPTASESAAAIPRQLFRPDAKAPSRVQLEGEVMLAVPASLRIVGLVALTALLAATIFAGFVHVPRIKSVTGWLQPQAGTVRVVARSAGIAVGVPVHQGDDVRSGDLLISFSTTQNLNGASAEEISASNLTAERSARRDGLLAQQRQLKLDYADQLAKRSFLEGQIEEARNRLSLAEGKLLLAKSALSRAEELLSKGAYAPAQLERDKAAVLDSELITSQARTGVLNLQDDLRGVQLALANFEIKLGAEEASFRLDDALVRQKETATTREASFEVIAPIDGEVASVLVTAGQPVKAGDTVAIINPKNSPLIAELHVPPDASGNLRRGQQVRLEFAAYPASQYGVTLATISDIDRTFVQPNEIAALPNALAGPVVRVRAALVKRHSESQQNLALYPGMVVTAKIVIEDRSILGWMLGPIMRGN